MTVHNVAPTAAVVTPAGGTQFGTANPVHVVVSFSDIGRADTHGCIINWGDSSSSTGVVVESNGSGTCSATHTYASPGNYTITVTVGDDDGSTATATVLVVIASMLLVIDEESIAKGKAPNNFTGTAVNDGLARVGLRSTLPGFAGANVGKELTLWTGQVGDEGWFAPKTIPTTWGSTQTTGIRNYLNAGNGLGSGSDPEKYLDKVPDVTPLRATGLKLLVGQTVCAVVNKSDVSINYGPLNGSLKGANLGLVGFKVISVTKLTGQSSTSLPKVTIQIVDRATACNGPVQLHTTAPAPTSSSSPNDVNP